LEHRADVALRDLDDDGDLDSFAANLGAALDTGQPNTGWLNTTLPRIPDWNTDGRVDKKTCSSSKGVCTPPMEARIAISLKMGTRMARNSSSSALGGYGPANGFGNPRIFAGRSGRRTLPQSFCETRTPHGVFEESFALPQASISRRIATP
jgi:hypothetical protein